MSFLQTANKVGFLKFKSDVTLLCKILHGFYSTIKTTSILLKLIYKVLAYLSNLISCPFPPHSLNTVTWNLPKCHLSITSMPLQCCLLCPPKTLFFLLMPNYLSLQVLVWTLFLQEAMLRYISSL